MMPHPLITNYTRTLLVDESSRSPSGRAVDAADAARHGCTVLEDSDALIVHPVCEE